MWTRRKAEPATIKTVVELVWQNQHKNLDDNMMIRLMPETDSYEVLNALISAREAGLIYCSAKRWGVRAKYLKDRS